MPLLRLYSNAWFVPNFFVRFSWVFVLFFFHGGMNEKILGCAWRVWNFLVSFIKLDCWCCFLAIRQKELFVLLLPRTVSFTNLFPALCIRGFCLLAVLWTNLLNIAHVLWVKKNSKWLQKIKPRLMIVKEYEKHDLQL